MTDREILEQLLKGQQQFDDRMQRVEERIQRVEVLLENTLPKHIQMIADQHGDIVKKLDALADYPETRGRVATLEHVVKAHTQDIEKLNKAVG